MQHPPEIGFWDEPRPYGLKILRYKSLSTNKTFSNGVNTVPALCLSQVRGRPGM